MPVTDRRVYFYAAHSLVARTFTDANGRYEFYALPRGAGRVYVVDPLDFDCGGPAAEQSVTVVNDVVLDLMVK